MEGAYYNGQYLNRLERLGYSQAEIDNKLESTFEEMFYGPEGVRLCHCAGPDMMYIEDTGNHDVRRSEERRVGKECRSRWSPDH